jgi:UDP-N-acetylmuramoylalanine--D-glutamate ligase
MKSVLVMGMQASGISASTLLEREGYLVKKYDDNLDFSENWKERKDIFNDLELVCVSPGIPSEHIVLREAIKRGISVVSELELGASRLNCELIMVTGTNGKTTTVDMIQRGLGIMGKKATAMGNIGYPITQVILDKVELDYAVIEISSFQLEHTSQLKAKIAAILNLAPDHIDRYKNYSEYTHTKEKVFQNQDTGDIAILNYDAREVRSIGERIKAEKIFVSTRESVGVIYIKNNYFYCGNEPLISVKESHLRGEHNRFNMLVALSIMIKLGGKKEHLISLIRDYRVPPHRIEYVSTIDGIRFYNDSKGTNIAACKCAIDSIKGRNIGLILGGSDKKEEFCDFFDELCDDIKYVTVTGANEVKIYSAAMKVGFSRICICASLEAAVKKLHEMKEIDTVLFSPACASFDKYSNYAERGNRFKQLVYALKA